MKNKIILLASQLLFTSSLLAGGTSGGTPPAISLEDMLTVDGSGSGIELGKGVLGGQRIEQLLSSIPSRDLIKTTDGKTLIPLSPENIRRLNMRTSAGIEASITTDKGEVFKLRKDLADKLIDKKKLAEVVEKLNEATLATESIPSK